MISNSTSVISSDSIMISSSTSIPIGDSITYSPNSSTVAPLSASDIITDIITELPFDVSFRDFDNSNKGDKKNGEKDMIIIKVENVLKIPEVKNVSFTDKATIVRFCDGTESVVKVGEGETFEPYMGFCAAIVKRLFGSTSAAKRCLKKKDVVELNRVKEEEKRKRIDEQKKREERNLKRAIRAEAKRKLIGEKADELVIQKKYVEAEASET